MRSPLYSTRTARRRLLLGTAVGMLALGATISGLAESSAPAAAGEVTFMRDVAPILAKNCFACHGAVEEPGGELRLDIYESMTKGDHPAVVAYDSEFSGMIERITEEDSSSRMPRENDPLSPADIDTLRRWINAGAKFDGPDPKTPYLPTPKAPAADAAPHPVPPPSAAADREQTDRAKAAAASESGSAKA